MPAIKRVAPQLLVSDLGDAIAFYEERPGFTTNFVYGDFYASVSRDGAMIHLKCAPRLDVTTRAVVLPRVYPPVVLHALHRPASCRLDHANI